MSIWDLKVNPGSEGELALANNLIGGGSTMALLGD